MAKTGWSIRIFTKRKKMLLDSRPISYDGKIFPVSVGFAVVDIADTWCYFPYNQHPIRSKDRMLVVRRKTRAAIRDWVVIFVISGNQEWMLRVT